MTSLTSVHSHTLATSFDIEGSSQASQLLRKMLSKAGLLYLILHDIRFDCSSTQTGNFTNQSHFAPYRYSTGLQFLDNCIPATTYQYTYQGQVEVVRVN